MPVDIAGFIAGLPKAELHVHLQGAASVETILELSHRYPDAGLPTDEATLREFYTFTDFAAFIRVYLAVNRLVRTADDVATLLRGLGRDLALVNVRYAEVTVTVDSHLQQGIAPDALADALATARRDVAAQRGVELGFVYDINGLDGVAAGERTVAWAEQFMPEHSVGFGLGGPETGVEPRTAYVDAFRRAAALGLASVPHAGETSGPESVREAIDDLHAVRVGHGIGAAADPRLMAQLADRGSRWRSARRRTSAPAPSPGWRTTRSRCCARPACPSPSTPTTRACSTRT